MLTVNEIGVKQKSFQIEKYYNKDVYIEAKVWDIYKLTNYNNSYIMDIVSINWVWDNYQNINFLLRLWPNMFLEKWEFISFETTINEVENFNDDFNYKRFLLVKNIFFISNPLHINILNKKETSKIDYFFINLRSKILNSIQNLFPKNESVLLSWILVWERNNIPLELSNSYNNSWLTHFISISWFHISILIIFLWFLFSFLHPYLRFIFISFFIFSFIMIVWFKVPAIRAAIMWIIWYYILMSGRTKDTLSLVLLTAILFVLYNPLFINYDISFHLSFLAVFWIIYTKNFWDKIFFFLPSFLAIKQSFVLTMSAMSWVLPIILINFWQFNIFSPIANMFVWGIMPFVMLFWFITLFFNFFSSTISYYIGYILYFLLKFINEVALFFWNLDFWIIKY